MVWGRTVEDRLHLATGQSLPPYVVVTLKRAVCKVVET